MLQSRYVRIQCGCRSQRGALCQILLDQCVSEGVGGLLPKLNQRCGWIRFGCGCGCEVVQLQQHVCADKMSSLRIPCVGSASEADHKSNRLGAISWDSHRS